MKAHRATIVFLVCITALTFSISLFNGFVGDDDVVIVHNTFYQSLDNLPSLFKKDYFPQAHDTIKHQGKNYYSGSVAYRPVLSATYFFDYFIWKLNPFGYHLSNLLLHVLNTVLVFFLVMAIVQNKSVAFFSSLLFGVHPLKVEAVCSIGYRADLLSCFFVLAAFLFFLRFANSVKRRPLNFALSTLCYLLALFAKESAIVFPFLLVAYDWHFQKYKLKGLLRNIKTRYHGFILATLFYLFVYIVIFPNQTLSETKLLGNNLIAHVATMFWILALYVVYLTMPFLVKVLPPLYAPSLEVAFCAKFAVAFILLGLLTLYMVKMVKVYKFRSFFMFWFLCSLIPVSNIIPIANPMAHRFVYLPSVGFLVVVAIYIEKLCQYLAKKGKMKNSGTIIKITIIGLCIAITYPMTAIWKSTLSVGLNLVQNYPRDIKSHSILGMEYFNQGKLKEAKAPLAKSIALGSMDPRDYQLLGICLLDEPEKAKRFFMMYPQFGSPYNMLGRKHFLNQEYEEAMNYLEEGIEAMPTFKGYIYLIQTNILLGKDRVAKKWAKEAKEKIKNPQQLQFLENLINPQSGWALPVDVGL